MSISGANGKRIIIHTRPFYISVLANYAERLRSVIMSNEAQEILRMIEGVSPSDTAKLVEINERTAFFLANPSDSKLVYFKGAAGYSWEWKSKYGLSAKTHQENYCISRDALKSIRPEGLSMELRKSSCGRSQCRLFKMPTDALGHAADGFMYPDKAEKTFSNLWYWTGEYAETLAELHSIIQAIDYERSHANPDPER